MSVIIVDPIGVATPPPPEGAERVYPSGRINSNSTDRPKRFRRTKSDMAYLMNALIEIVEQEAPMTVRQVFYQAVTRKLIDKTEAEYKETIVRLLADLRREGLIDWYNIVDNTRLIRRPATFDNVQEALKNTASLYRRAVFSDLDVYVEVWLEKEALAGVLVDVTWEYDVPLMTTRGYSSLSFLHAAAQQIERAYDAGKEVYLYNFGDHDPSGVDIARQIQEGIAEFTDAPFEFERVAVTPMQIKAWDLPTRPTKSTDTRSRNFDGSSVELDAITPRRLRELCRGAIERHIPDGHIETLKAAEASEKDIIRAFAKAA